MKYINKTIFHFRIFYKILFFVSLIFFLDAIIGYTLKYYYNKQISGWLYRTSYALDSTNADLLIFGASRANHHYYSRLFQQKFNLTSYNTGRDGNAIFYHYGILQSIIKRYHPKVAILDFSHAEFIVNQDSYERISSFLPYYHNHSELQSIVHLKSRYEKFKLLSHIYPYNSLLFQIIAGNSRFNLSRQNRSDDFGYVPLYKKYNGSTVNKASYGNYQLDTIKINYFKKFIDVCVLANIKLYIILSPCYLTFNDLDSSVIIAKKLAAEKSIPFLDFSKEKTFLNNPNIYADESHLNDSGAKIFTQMVIDKLYSDFTFYKFNNNHTASIK